MDESTKYLIMSDRLAVERAEREERITATEQVHQRYRGKFEEIWDRCEQSGGHGFIWVAHTVGGHNINRCKWCNKTTREDPDY